MNGKLVLGGIGGTVASVTMADASSAMSFVAGTLAAIASGVSIYRQLKPKPKKQ